MGVQEVLLQHSEHSFMCVSWGLSAVQGNLALETAAGDLMGLRVGDTSGGHDSGRAGSLGIFLKIRVSGESSWCVDGKEVPVACSRVV